MKKYTTQFIIVVFLITLTSCTKNSAQPTCEQGGEEVKIQSEQTH